MDSPLSHRPLTAIYRKASNVLGITARANTTTPVHHSQIPPRLEWLRRKLTPSPSTFVWDNPVPFAYPPPLQADAVQARIEHERRNESVGPFDPVTYYNFASKYDEYDLEEDDYDDFDDDDDSYDSYEDDGDADDEDEEEDYDSDSDVVDSDDDHSFIYRPLNMPIALPQLLHTTPLCFIPSSVDHSPPPSEAETRVPTPPMLLLYPSSESESETEFGGEHLDKEEPSWAGLAAVYNNIAEAEERAARKVKRDAERERSKVLAILEPEASPAL